MTDIKDAAEALKWLYLLVECGEEVIKGIDHDPADLKVEADLPDVTYMMVAASFFPPMVESVKAVIDQGDEFSDRGSQLMAIALARAYQPAMVELGWVPK